MSAAKRFADATGAPVADNTKVRQGFADSLIELAVRFVISHEAVSTALVGISTLEHLEYAAAAAIQGPLPREAIERIAAAQNSFLGEPR